MFQRYFNFLSLINVNQKNIYMISRCFLRKKQPGVCWKSLVQVGGLLNAIWKGNFHPEYKSLFFSANPFKKFKFSEVLKFPLRSQPTQRRRKDVVKTSYFWSQRRLRLVWNGNRDDLFLRCRQDVFQETS